MKPGSSISPAASISRAFHTIVPEPVRSPLMPAVEHRPDRQRDGRDVDRRGRHQAGRRGLVAADGQHHAVERIAVEHLDQAQIGEVAVEAGGRALAGLLDRVDREFDGDAARLANAFAHALGQHEVMAVAGREVAAGLGDADDRLARLQLLEAEAEIRDSARDRARSCRCWPGCRTRRASAGGVRRSPGRWKSSFLLLVLVASCG